MNIGESQNKLKPVLLKARFLPWESCRGLALAANSGVSTLGFKMCSLSYVTFIMQRKTDFEMQSLSISKSVSWAA